MTSTETNDLLETARAALARHAWREAREALTAAADAQPLNPDDLMGLADASWWTGDIDGAISARERAHTLYLETGNGPGAAAAALGLVADYGHKVAPAVAAGWQGRAERILKDLPECRELGLLHRVHLNQAFGAGRFQEALDRAGEMLDIANRLADRDLQALAIHEQGRALVRLGRVDEGMALLDEAAVAAVSGDLGPNATAIIYCNVIGACRSLADYRRAGDWTEAAKRWCERQSITGFPGYCRVFRAEIMRLRGDFQLAETEALSACDELGTFALDIVGAAFNEVGDIRLRMGDLEGAEEAFRQAHGAGNDPQPGLALLRLAQGNVAAASSGVRRALSEIDQSDRLARARLLPAFTEIMVADGDLASAKTAIAELKEVSEAFGSDAMRAAAACAEGAVLVADGDATGAIPHLRLAFRLWQGVDTPYEAARCRLLLATAYRAAGDEDAALLEAAAARSTFEKLGARLDVVRAAEFIAGDKAMEVAARRDRRTFMFTDICKSTDLLEAIGDDAWGLLLGWHDQTLRALFEEHHGEEIKHAGDGFFTAFPSAGSAIACAVAIQRTLEEHRRSHGFSPEVRVGLHTDEATRKAKDYHGRGVHIAARVGAAAQGGEILISDASLVAGAGGHQVSDARDIKLKGIATPMRVVTLNWR